MTYQKRLLAISGITGALFLVPATCFAGAGAQELVQFVNTNIILQALAAFWGISWAAMFYYAIQLILNAQKEDAFSTASNSFIYAFTGFAIIACANAFAQGFSTTGFSGGNIPGFTPLLLGNSIESIWNFMIYMSAGIFVLMIVIAGIRMVTTQGEQAAFDTAKHLLVINCSGVALMLIAKAIVSGVSTNTPELITEELRGIALFLLTIMGFACVLALIIAGLYLIISIDESYRDKAKKIVIGTLITLTLLFVVYGLIFTFVYIP
jgi:hypothetical protein